MENKNPFLEMKKAASERVRLIYESQEAGETVARNFRKAGQDCFRTVKTISRHFEQVTGAWHEITKNPKVVRGLRISGKGFHQQLLNPKSGELSQEDVPRGVHGRLSGNPGTMNLAFQASRSTAFTITSFTSDPG